MTSSGPLPGKKRKRKPDSATERLDQIESLGDRLGNWIAQNAVMLGGVAAVVLLSAAMMLLWSLMFCCR